MIDVYPGCQRAIHTDPQTLIAITLPKINETMAESNKNSNKTI